jgi:hypothetical protein
MMNYHRLFEKNVFYFLQKVQKKCKKSKKYFTCISIKIGSISETFFTKMISTKSSTNRESFIKFGRGRRIDLATSHGYTHMFSLCHPISVYQVSSNLV